MQSTLTAAHATHLENTGRLLFGERWRTELADLLRVNERTVRRWAAGAAIPRGIWQELLAATIARATLLASQTTRLKSLIDDLPPGR